MAQSTFAELARYQLQSLVLFYQRGRWEARVRTCMRACVRETLSLIGLEFYT